MNQFIPTSWIDKCLWYLVLWINNFYNVNVTSVETLPLWGNVDEGECRILFNENDDHDINGNNHDYDIEGNNHDDGNKKGPMTCQA